MGHQRRKRRRRIVTAAVCAAVAIGSFCSTVRVGLAEPPPQPGPTSTTAIDRELHRRRLPLTMGRIFVVDPKFRTGAAPRPLPPIDSDTPAESAEPSESIPAPKDLPLRPATPRPLPPVIAPPANGRPDFQVPQGPASKPLEARRPAAPSRSLSVPSTRPRRRPAVVSAPQLAPSEALGRRIRYAYGLARKGATFTANAELLRALQMTAEGLDERDQRATHSAALVRAMRAMKEAEDFVKSSSAIDATLDWEQIIAGHRTPVLRHASHEQLTSVKAMQAYFAYAADQLAEALRGAPQVADALYGLGRLQPMLAKGSAAAPKLRSARAIVYYQVALSLEPKHALAANELGVLFARLGRWNEAKSALLRAVSTRPTPEMWHNLATVHRRLGEERLAELAQAEQKYLQPADRVSRRPKIEWVGEDVFRRQSGLTPSAR